MAKVFIGVGHGGSDPGAVANGFKEKDLALTISLSCRDELVRHGVSVQMSRTTDVSEQLNDKINRCNAYNPDYALDIHINAGGGDGAEVFHHYGGGKGKTLATNILTEMVNAGQNSRGTKIKKNSSGLDYFGFIRLTNAPAVIVECAFIDNKKDIAIIDTTAEQKAMGVVIAKGVLKTLGIKYIEKKKEEPKVNQYYYVRKSWANTDSQVGAYSISENAVKKAKETKLNVYDWNGKLVWEYKEPVVVEPTPVKPEVTPVQPTTPVKPKVESDEPVKPKVEPTEPEDDEEKIDNIVDIIIKVLEKLFSKLANIFSKK